ncbi:MAG: DUF3788 family protein [Bacteroidetes bacterium]|nr:DUF3788 family protein [Bacteroidota bacterium]
METHVLSDKNQFPTREVLAGYLGKSQALWDAFFEFIHTEHPDFHEEWRYYNDGKRWLMKITHKKKTVFWLGVNSGSFRITAYLVERAKKAIASSALSSELKEQFAAGKKFGTLKSVTITFKRKRDIADARVLADLKLSVK